VADEVTHFYYGDKRGERMNDHEKVVLITFLNGLKYSIQKTQSKDFEEYDARRKRLDKLINEMDTVLEEIVMREMG
jgi:hypothetical protein